MAIFIPNPLTPSKIKCPSPEDVGQTIQVASEGGPQAKEKKPVLGQLKFDKKHVHSIRVNPQRVAIIFMMTDQ